MIVYAACVADQHKFDTICHPGIARAFRDGDIMVTTSSTHSIFEAYNEVLDAFRDRTDLEALVLLHEDTEILSRSFSSIVRDGVASPGIAVLGVVGGTGARGIAWWEGNGVGRVEETVDVVDFGVTTGDVDTVDGLMLVLSPWSVRNLRFDDATFTGFDGYDADICRQAREAGKRVRCVPLPIAHRHHRGPLHRENDDGGSFRFADAMFRMKWDPNAGPAPLARDEVELVESAWMAHLTPMVAADARRVLHVGDDTEGARRALGTDSPARDITTVSALGDVAADDRFDVVMFADALERTSDPGALLATARGHLNEGGRVVFAVPNVGSYLYLLLALVKGGRARRHAFEESVAPPVHLFTRREIDDLVAASGMCIDAVSTSTWRNQAFSDVLLPPVASARGDSGTDERLSALRYFVSARVAPGAAVTFPVAPRRGSQVDEGLAALMPSGCGRIARIDEMLGGDGAVTADEEIAEAIAGLDGGAYDAIVLGTALEHAQYPGRALRAARALLAPGGVVLASVANALRFDLLGALLERDAWTYGEGALAHHPVSYYTRVTLDDVAADGGLVVRGVEDEPADVDPARVARWSRVASELGCVSDIATPMGVARMRAVMVAAVPPATVLSVNESRG